MPTRDWRTVGELLADSDALARETLLDVSPDAAPAMMRTFVQVVQSGARLWSVLPPTSLVPAPEPDVMVRLQVVGRGIGRSVSLSRWPGSGPIDERLAQVAYNLSRAVVLVERHGRGVQPTTAGARADIEAARARVMHTLYVGAHGTSVAVRGYATELQDQLQTAARRNRPLSDRPNPKNISAANAMLNRLDVFEQMAANYVAAHPVTVAGLGEVAVPVRATRLDSALARWDIQAHRTLASNPTPPHLVRVSRVQALIATTTAVFAEAAAQKGTADPEVIRRLSPALDATQVAWSQAAKRWSELRPPGGLADPALIHAASEVRAAVAASAYGRAGWAKPDVLDARLDLRRTVKTLHLGLVASVDIAYLSREVAAIGQSLNTPVRATAIRAQPELEKAVAQGETGYAGQTWATPVQVARNQSIPLPQSVRRGLVQLADDVIAAATKAVSRSAPLDSGHASRPSGSSSKRDAGRAATVRDSRLERTPEGPQR